MDLQDQPSICGPIAMEKQRLNCESLDYKGQFILKRSRCCNKYFVLSKRCFMKRTDFHAVIGYSAERVQNKPKDTKKMALSTWILAIQHEQSAFGKSSTSKVNIYFPSQLWKVHCIKCQSIVFVTKCCSNGLQVQNSTTHIDISHIHVHPKLKL